MENRSVKLPEEWIRLGDDKIPDGEYIVTNFVQNKDGTRMLLDDEKYSVEIVFDGIPLLIRQAMEGLRMHTWGEVQKKYNNKAFFRDHFFYLVENSLLVKWAVEEGVGFYDEGQIKHYCIVTSEELIDILATFEPTITVTDYKKPTQ